jgi:zinc protease
MTYQKESRDENNVVRHRLKNGATVLIKEDPTSPVVSLNLWVEAGSIDERPEERGMAHLIEHMIFKGTAQRGVGAISREVEAAGGYLNAFTSFEHTCFYVVLPAAQIQKALEVEFDAYLNSTFDGNELKKEKEVVFEEMRMRQDDPWSWSWELLFQILYRKNPYHWPVIGDMEILGKVPRETLLKYYRKHYVPSNTVITIVGGVSADKMIKWIRSHFENVTRPQPPRRHFAFDQEPRGLQLRLEPGEVQQVYVSAGFPSVSITHPDAAPLEILEAVLGDGSASRLNLAIREKSRSADEVGSEHFSGKYGGAFVFQALTDQGRVEACLADAMAEIKKIVSQGVTDGELSKIKNKIKASKIFEKQNADGQAKTLGFWELHGDYRMEGKFLAALDSVTAADLRRVAEKYLKPSRVSLVLYHPKAQKMNRSPAHWQSVLQRGWDSTEASTKRKLSHGSLRKFKLKNGSTLWVKERNGLPLVSLGAFLKGGFSVETQKQGITSLMTKCLLKGTRKHNHEEFSKEVEALAAHLDPLMEKDYWGMTLDVLKTNFEKAFDLMMESLYEPVFARAEVEKERRLQIAAIERLKDDPGEYALLQSDILTFDKTPYGHMPMGTAQSLSALSAQDIKNWHRRHLSHKNTTWVAVGDFEGESLKRYLDSKLSFPLSGKAPTPPSVSKFKLKSKEFKMKTDSRQANLVLGFRAPTFNSREYFTFRVLNTILNGMGGRLFSELREKRSLAYSVFAAHDAGWLAGIYQVYIGCAPSKIDEAKRELQKVIQKFCEVTVGREELERAKTYMIGLYQVGFQSNRAQVHSYARYDLAGIGAPRVNEFPRLIRKVTAQDVRTAARKYLNTPDRTWVLLTPNDKEK